MKPKRLLRYQARPKARLSNPFRPMLVAAATNHTELTTKRSVTHAQTKTERPQTTELDSHARLKKRTLRRYWLNDRL